MVLSLSDKAANQSNLKIANKNGYYFLWFRLAETGPGTKMLEVSTLASTDGCIVRWQPQSVWMCDIGVSPFTDKEGLTYPGKVEENVLSWLIFESLWHVQFDKGSSGLVIITTCTLHCHPMSLDCHVSVESFEDYDDNCRDQPLPEGRIVDVYAMQEKENVKHKSTYKVGDVEWNETKLFAHDTDACQTHHCEN